MDLQVIPPKDSRVPSLRDEIATSMSYVLLTGATGLLGNYLLRNLLRRDVPVAVLVRRGRKQSARERVEQLLLGWESSTGESLPRPVVLDGDLTQPDLGLDANSLRWATEYCGSVINNAASLQFVATSPEGEPYRSNIGGMQNVLEFCRQAGVRQFHHVSTAYVAGVRRGKALETELDVGQTLGNDYEKSKLTSEKMAREFEGFDQVTVYRPGIIIGDSKTGYTTTYHGFYAALQLAHTIASSHQLDETGHIGGQSVRLALEGNETKHLVPVDWVADVMTHVFCNPEWHGKTYHLTPEHPATTRMIRDTLQQSCGFYGVRFAGANGRPDDLTEAEALFYEHIRVYDSYWRMDPEFDRTNTLAAAPHLPCPHVGLKLLNRLSRQVIADDFPTPGKRPLDLDHDSLTLLQGLLDAGQQLSASGSAEQALGLDVRGCGGGQYRLLLNEGRVVGAEIGIPGEQTGTVTLATPDLESLCEGRATPRQLLENRKLTIAGWEDSIDECLNLLSGALRSLTQPVR